MAKAPVPASSSTWSREDQGRMGGTRKGASHRCNLHCPSQTGRCYSCSCRAAAPLCPPRHRKGRGRCWHPFPHLRAPQCTQSRGTGPLAGREGRPSTASPLLPALALLLPTLKHCFPLLHPALIQGWPCSFPRLPQDNEGPAQLRISVPDSSEVPAPG